ncbi:MAG: 30S ribosomal protein S9 [Clostridia bacterium]|nr:30S ribosomal protein S9 [Clostridia bacterium]MDD4685701.1 30S ribosomal protein S9 [Clostridia bacterium]
MEEKKVAKKNIKAHFTATGRRKQAIARVFLVPNGTGNIIVNKVDVNEYFPLDTLKLILKQPLALTNSESKFDIKVNVNGGGLTGQAGAICLGIARALVKCDETFKPELKKAGLLTRDARKKERKKYGLKKARKAPQFTKGGS